MTLTPELKNIFAIWKKVNAYPISKSDEAMLYFMQEMISLLKIDSADWLAGATGKNFKIVPSAEMVNDWYVVDTLSIDPTTTSRGKEERYYRYMELKQIHGVDPLTSKVIDGAGQTRARLLQDTFPNIDEWHKQWLYQELYQPHGRSDVLHVVFNVDPLCESFLVFYKAQGAEPFTEQEKNLILIASAGVNKLHQRMLHLRGATQHCKDLLSPQEKIVIKALFTGAREKDIADILNVSISMARKHSLSIYRKLDVLGKLELLASSP